MESYWCEKKNSIIDQMKNPENNNPALTPCLKSECDRWDNGSASLSTKLGKKITL